MQKAHLIEVPTAEAKAWQVSFGTTPPRGDHLRIVTPRPLFAQWTPIDIAAPPAASAAGDANRPLAVLWMPTGAPSEVEAGWVAAIPAGESSQRVVRAGLRTARIVWTDRLAIIYTAEEQLDDALDALIRFTVVERDASALEAKMPAIWASIDADTPLTHTVLASDHDQRKADVNRTTETVTRMAGSALRLEIALEQLDPALQSSSKRLFAELALQAGLEDRLEMLAEPIDFAIEHYELINSRMIEARQFMIEGQQFEVGKKQAEIERKQATASLVVEIIILAVLVADLVFIAYPYLAK
jgi:hypothetical protein